MVFPWNIAKSAETVFSRWAVKRVCKFLLKKKLGKLILGEIDLDQLDVQLRDGTIQLFDLAINADYLNDKFNAPLLIKEGSIGSLLVKMPWKSNGCQVEVDELELVLAPRLECNASSANEPSSSSSTQEGSHSMHLGKHGNELLGNSVKSASMDVHEGVKTVAKIVKWFLTSFHVRIKKLIIAFDPCFGIKPNEVGPCPTLVFRLSEIECGINASEDTVSTNEDNFLGISRLTNCIKFQGAVLELLQMDCLNDDKTCGTKSSNAVTLIMTGKGGGFSGCLNSSIPWRNGSLDIRKVDADLCIDPIEVRLQPSTIKWILWSWESFKSLDSDHCRSGSISADSSSMPPTDKTITPDGLSALVGQAVEGDESIVTGLQFISDWFPSSFSKKEVDGEVDLGASVDQFFECFDAMRSYHSAFGSQGMWNWTSSVFTAISAASTLASGSLHLPCEQQHIETSFKVSISGISMVLFFQDEDNWKNTCMGVHYMGAEFRDISVTVQICPRDTRLEGTMSNIEIANYFHEGNTDEKANIEYRTSLINDLQAEIQNVLPPPFASSDGCRGSDSSSEIVSDGFLSRNKGFAVQTTLIISAGCNGFQFSCKSQSSEGRKSFSLSLPPTTVWLDLHSVKLLANLFVDVSESIPKSSHESKNDGGSWPGAAESSKSDRLSLNVSIRNARAILCFPFENYSQRLCGSLWNQFIILDLSSPPTAYHKETETYFASADRSICFSVGDASLYLVSSDPKDDEQNSYSLTGKFSVYKILDTCKRTNHQLSTIGLYWQMGSVGGAWVMEKAKILATQEEAMKTNKSMGGGLEFAAVATPKDHEDIYSQTRKEITLASSSWIYVHLIPLTICLCSLQYTNLCHLLDHLKIWLSSILGSSTATNREESDVRQTSLIVECDSLDILVTPEAKDIRKSLQSEIPGSWTQLKLRIQKLNLMSVSNLGNICNADFFWLAHGEGRLWGSISDLDEEFLLISCSNSAIKRGNGGGSNALSSRLAGLDIMKLRDPRGSHDSLSVSVSCCTFVAVGGRLDWVEVATSFFVLPSVEAEEAVNKNPQGRDSNSSSASFFMLNLVDVGLSYEPYFKNIVVVDCLHQPGDSRIACLVAASSFSLSNTGRADDYGIRVQDLGLLLSVVSDPDICVGTYSAQYLHKAGYVRVAQEALIEAILRSNSENGLLWELECLKSHLVIETCSDTTSGLIRLATQLQQLLAPDLEESAVHLQTRWDNIQEAQATCDLEPNDRIFSSEPSSQIQNLGLHAETELGVFGLMDEINEEAFAFDDEDDDAQCGSSVFKYGSMSSDASYDGEAFTHESPEILSNQFLCGSSSSGVKPESNQRLLERDGFPEIIENYCLSEFHPFSELPQEGDPSEIQVVLDAGLKKGSSGWYNDAALRILEDHVSEAAEEDCEEQMLDAKSLRSESTSCSEGNAIGRVLVKNINFKWRMYSGFHWHEYYAGKKSETNRRNLKGKNTDVCLELELSGMQFLFEIFPAGGICTSQLFLTIQDFYLYDRSKAAPWTLIFGYYNSKDHPRDSSSKAFKLDLKVVRPDPQTPLEEYCLRVALLPLLLHLHQSQLDFLISFFGGNNTEKPVGSVDDSVASASSIDSLRGHNIIEEALLPYFQKFDIWPVTVRVDYNPHHVDLAALTGGKYAELVNLVPWKGIELKLKHVHATGIYGWGNVCETILGEWLEDISQNQIRKLLKGIPTLRSISALYAAASKLVSSPVESYRKDRRIVKGVQRGTISFLRSLSLEAVGLGVHLAAGAHDILLRAEYVLASTPSPMQSQGKANPKANVRHNQPRNARQGMLQACKSIGDGLEKSASAIVCAPFKKYQRGEGAGSALATAVQGVPTAAIAPASACARAVHTALVGIRNSLDPEHKKESMEKYLGPDKRRNQD